MPNYPGLGFTMDLATQVIPISADADVSLSGDPFEVTDPVGYGNTLTSIRPIYERVTDNSIHTGSLNDPVGIYNQIAYLTDEILSGDVTPQVLIEEAAGCINNEWHYEVRLKGDFTQTGDTGEWFRMSFGYWDGVGDIRNMVDIVPPVYHYVLGEGSLTPFDSGLWVGDVVLPDGVGVYSLIQNLVVGTSIVHGRIVNFDPETSFLLSNTKECPPTKCEVNMVNETLARATEAITDSCLTVKSDYYGRTDSQPYASIADGCGGLRVFTNGLKVRRADDKLFFESTEELLLGLRAIDNIGMGMEPNTLTNTGEWVRIEPVEYFYQDVKIMELPAVPKSRSQIDEQNIYSNIKTGYNKWAIESIKGIDEFNSYKERRTGIKSVNRELDISCNLVASGYIIAKLRTDSLVNTGQTDNSYDNDTFIICVKRGCTYSANFYADNNKVFIVTNGDGSQFAGLTTITIAGTTSNDGVRSIDNITIIPLPGDIADVIIEFSGGTTVDEVLN